MSKNRNRAKLNKATNNHEYRILWLKEEFPPYYDEGWNWKQIFPTKIEERFVLGNTIEKHNGSNSIMGI